MAEEILDYSFHETEVRKAIANEAIKGINLEGLPIEVSYADIDQVANDDYIIIRRDGFGASDSSILLGVNPFKSSVSDVIYSICGFFKPLLLK